MYYFELHVFYIPLENMKEFFIGRFCIAEGPVQWSVAFAPLLLGLLAMIGWFRHSISAAVDMKFVAISWFQNRKLMKKMIAENSYRLMEALQCMAVWPPKF